MTCPLPACLCPSGCLSVARLLTDPTRALQSSPFLITFAYFIFSKVFVHQEYGRQSKRYRERLALTIDRHEGTETVRVSCRPVSLSVPSLSSLSLNLSTNSQTTLNILADTLAHSTKYYEL